MIKDSDLLFHTPRDCPYDWAETGFFNFYIPDQNILGIIYIVHRAGVGATVSDIELMDQVSGSSLGSIYADLTNHNRLPERAERFVLESGLSFEATSIRDYVIRYEADRIALDLSFTGVMEPYDIHDPTMDPLASPEIAHAIANSGFGAAYTAHFDMTVAVKGTVRLGDSVFPVDCVSTIDHSWGPRPENGFHPIVWTNAHYNRENCLHAIFVYHPGETPERQHEFKHGYALVDGKVRGAISATMVAEQDGPFARRLHWTLTDVDGNEHHAVGEMLTYHPWLPYANNLSPLQMMAWRDGGTKSGTGTYMQGIPLNKVRKF